LRHLLFDGQPVESSTVISWLNLCYMSVYGRPYEQQTQQQSTALSADELYQLLAFADAINSTKVPLVTKTCTAELEQLSMQVSLEGEAVQLVMDGRPYWFCRRRAGGQTQVMFCKDGSMKLLRSPDAKSALQTEVSQQCEQLLFMAYKLRLDQLLQWVQRFIAMVGVAPVSAAGSYDSTTPLLPSDVVSLAVYNPRVFEAAGYTEEKGQAAWAADQAGYSRNLCLLRPDASPGAGKASPPPCLRLLSAAAAHRLLQFKAEVQGQGFAGFKPGTEVDVTLDIAGSSIGVMNPTVKISGSSRVGQMTFPVTLSIDSSENS
jgi:hypothetical protein